MTKQEYDQIVKIIENELHETWVGSYLPRLVINQAGVERIKKKGEEMVNE